jgi:hypothetical protein
MKKLEEGEERTGVESVVYEIVVVLRFWLREPGVRAELRVQWMFIELVTGVKVTSVKPGTALAAVVCQEAIHTPTESEGANWRFAYANTNVNKTSVSCHW